MFAFKLATILAVASTVVVAVPTPAGGGCGTQPVQCCDSIAPNGPSSDASLVGLLPLNLQDSNVPIGVNCLPISVIGAGSSGTCNAQAACCNGIDNSGSIPIGIDCSPINVGL